MNAPRLTKLAQWWLRRRGFIVLPPTGNVVAARGPVNIEFAQGSAFDFVVLGEGVTANWVPDLPPTLAGANPSPPA